MSPLKRVVSHGLAAAGLFAMLGVSGCAVHAGVGYRVYDPYYSDYHVWNDGEVGFYNNWAAETHRDPHRDFRKLNHNDQQEYWKWRHDHH
jgi:hypothetical protein